MLRIAEFGISECTIRHSLFRKQTIRFFICAENAIVWQVGKCIKRKAVEQSGAGRTTSNLFPEMWIFPLSISKKYKKKIQKKKTSQEIFTKRRLTRKELSFCPKL